MKIKFYSVLIYLVFGLAGILPASEVRIFPGPDQMPAVDQSMQSADFWVSRLDRPDKVLVSQAQAKKMREAWVHKDLIKDIFLLPEKIVPATLREWLKADFSYLRRVAQYDETGKPWTREKTEWIIKNVNLQGIKGSKTIEWGMTVRRTALRLFPTDQIATVKPKDIEFNILLHSGLRLAEPVAIVHYSSDGQWCYVVSTVDRGWVLTKDVAKATDRVALKSVVEQSVCTVVAREITLQQHSGRKPLPSARMGCRLAVTKDHHALFNVPCRTAKGALYFEPAEARPEKGIMQGTRPCTARVIIEQAFAWYGVDYGWGGASGYGDCSEFIRRIGLTCGLELPRSTTGLLKGLNEQRLPRRKTEKMQALKRLEGGSALLYLPGHIMLVLGRVEGKLFVIHNLYGIHGQDAKGPLIKRVDRVVVSDLSLGEGSQKGSLFDRISAVLLFHAPLDKRAAFD